MKKYVSVVLLLLVGCASGMQGNGNSNRVDVSPAKFKKLVDEGKCVVIDVRTQQEYSSGHIPGATQIDFYSADFWSRLKKLDKSKAYCVYCRSGRRSGITADSLAKWGYKVYNLRGGFRAWSSEGFPVER